MSQGMSQPLGLQDDRTTTIPISGAFRVGMEGDAKEKDYRAHARADN